MRLRANFPLALVLATAAACATDDLAAEDLPLDEPALRDYQPQLPPGVHVSVDEGSVVEEASLPADSPLREVTLRRGGKLETVVAAVDPHGQVILGGDIVLGDEKDLVAHAGEGGRVGYSFTIEEGTGRHWPGADIAYHFSTAPGEQVPTATRNRILAAMDLIAQRSPIRFIEGTSAGGHLFFVRSQVANASRSPFGRQPGANQVAIWESHSVGVITHVLLHALGHEDEHQRPNPTGHVWADLACIPDAFEAGFAVNHDDELRASRAWDYESITHRGSHDMCPRDASGQCTCKTIVNTSFDCPPWVCMDFNQDGPPEFIQPNRSKLSSLDISGLYLEYSRPLGGTEAGDQLGATQAVGDFDGDGLDDLAVGAPGEAPGSEPKSGVVFLYKGTDEGLRAWRVLTQETRPVLAGGTLGPALGENLINDRFGAALAAGDFNGDGIDDLAVGAPGDMVTGEPALSGSVMIFVGFRNLKDDARFGLQPWKLLTQESVGGQSHPSDQFGFALAAGNVDGGADDLAIGTPFDRAAGIAVRTGTFVIARGSASGLSAWPVVAPSLRSGDDLFGSALALADFDGDGDDDVIVGAPGHDLGSGNGLLVDSGLAELYFSGPNGLTSVRVYTGDSADVDHAGDRFGAALAAGNLLGTGGRELAISSPGYKGGRVALFKGVHGAPPVAWKLLAPPAEFTADQDGDDFGAALLISRIGAHTFLLVGAPGNAAAVGSPRLGTVFGFIRGVNDQVRHVALLSQWQRIFPDLTTNRFGASLAVGRFDSGEFPTLSVGLPGIWNQGGALHMFSYPGGDPTLIRGFGYTQAEDPRTGPAD